MKKITRIILTVVLLFTFSLNVKAVTITTDNTKQGTTDTGSYLVTNTGTITINNVENDTFKGYKILDFYYNSSTDSITQEFTSEFKTFLATTTDYKNLTVEQYKNLTSGDTYNYSTQTNSTLDTLVSQYATYIASNNINGTALTTTPPPDAMTRGYATGTFPVGAYLVLPVNTPKVYAVMVGNIELQAENNSWNIQNAMINAKVSSTSITKTVVSGGTLKNNKYYIKTTDIITNRLTVTVPTFPTNATNHDFVIVDQQGYMDSVDAYSTGLVFNSATNAIVIKDGTKQLTITDIEETSGSYTAKIKDGNTEVGDMAYSPNGEEVLDGDGSPKLVIFLDAEHIQSDTITVEYQTKMNLDDGISNSTESIGKNGFVTRYKVCTGSAYDNNSVNCNANSEFVFYSYGIELTTKDNNNTVLAGASYKLYSDTTLNTEVGSFINYGSGNYYRNYILGLDPGTYYVKQTSAPNGKSINNETFTVNIPDSQEGYVELTVTNSGTNVLPVTGGAGTIMFIIIGLFIIGGAIVYYRFNKAVKKNAEV